MDINCSSEQNPFANKINKIINRESENESFLESLQVISEFYVANTIRTRRNLRTAIDAQRLSVAEKVLGDMTSVKLNLDSLSTELENMLTSCKRINSRLKDSKSRMEELVNQTNSSQSKRISVNLTKMAADAFLRYFYITSEEWELLKKPPSRSVSEPLLVSLQRAKNIVCAFQSAISYPTTRLSKDTVKSAKDFIDKAYEHIYNWIKREVSYQMFEAVEISVVLRKCLEEIQERPILFKYVLDEYASARHKVIAEAFISVLTTGRTPGSTTVSTLTKPIEMQSHDPLRYSGDMLAWVHQTLASEKEYLLSLVSDKVDIDLMHDCLNNITNGLAYPLQIRLEQILVTEHNAVLLYKVNNILQFYSSVIMNLLGPKSAVNTTLSELQSLSWNLFISVLQQQTMELLTQDEVPRNDLLPSASAVEVCRLLEAILNCRDMSYAASDVRQTKCEEIVSVVIDPLLAHFEMIAIRLSEASTTALRVPDATLGPAWSGATSSPVTLTTEALVYLLNGYKSVHASLAKLEFTGSRLAQIDARVEQIISQLTSEQALYVLMRCGLGGIHAALEAGHNPITNGPLICRTDLPEGGVSEGDIQAAIAQFNTYLANPDYFDLPDLQSIAFSRPRTTLRRQAIDLLLSFYSRIYDAITDPENSYEPVDALKTPQQVAELISTS